MYEKKLASYFETHTAEFLRDLSRLISIPSIKSAPAPAQPFGCGPARVLDAALSLASSYGLHAENWDNYVGIVDIGPSPRMLDILVHLDVVPSGDGWTVTTPFCMKQIDGIVYGRGTCDDKGPALAALYALRAIHELSIPLSRGVRLVFGTDEESGSADLAYYFRNFSPAAMTFSPDAVYPVITAEKGRFEGHLTADFTHPQLVSICAGQTINMIPATAEAVLQNIDFSYVQSFIKQYDSPCKAEIIPVDSNSCRIRLCGISGHAASPEDAVNPVTAMLCFLSELLTCKELRTLSGLFPFGSHHGTELHIDMEDRRSGRLTLSLTQLHYSNGCLQAAFDSRVPICGTNELLSLAGKTITEAGFLFTSSISLPHSVPEDTPFIRGLLDSYESVSGKPGQTLAIGGGTYAHGIDNAVAFGCMTDSFSNHMHGADECAEISTLQMSCRIFAESVIRLCGIPSVLLPANPPCAGLLWLGQPDSTDARSLFQTLTGHGIAVMSILCDKRAPIAGELLRAKSALLTLLASLKDATLPIYVAGIDCGAPLAAQLAAQSGSDCPVHLINLPCNVSQAAAVILRQIL